MSSRTFILIRLAEYLEAAAAWLMDKAIGVPTHTRHCGQPECGCFMNGQEDARHWHGG